nr:MAG TPA: hypothetical protein [Caudoviricetes sp.]
MFFPSGIAFNNIIYLSQAQIPKKLRAVSGIQKYRVQPP